MSILSRYTIREILSHLAGVMLIVVAIFMVRHFAAFLSDAAAGTLPSDVLLNLLAFRTVMALPSLLPVAVYVAVLLGLARLHQDNEMTALASCGVPPSRIYTAVVGFGIAAAVVAAGLSFWARPWAAVSFHAARDKATREAGVDQMAPGRFYEIGSGTEQAVFAESRSRTDPQFIENVFVQQRDDKGTAILFAARATEVVDLHLGYRFLRLLDGFRYDLGSDAKEIEVTRYQELVIRTPLEDASQPDSSQNHDLSALELARSPDPEDAAELQWRLASPVSAMLLVLLAIPLSRIRFGQGSYVTLLVAVILYLGYSQLLGTVKKWVANGVWAPLPGTWMVHALCLTLAIALLLTARRLEDDRPWRWGGLTGLQPRARSGSELGG